MKALLITGLSCAAMTLITACATTTAPSAALPSSTVIAPSSGGTATAAPTVHAVASPTPTLAPTPPAVATVTPTPTSTTPPTPPAVATTTPKPTVATVVGPSPAPAVGVLIWMADYRPQWMGYINSDGRLVAVAPNDNGGTAATYPNVTYQNYHFPPHGPDDKLVVTWTDKTGMIGTAVFAPGTQMQFDALLATWRQQLASVQAAALLLASEAEQEQPAKQATAIAMYACAVGVQGHDAAIVFTGDNAHALCTTVSANRGMEPRTVASTANMDQVCIVPVKGTVALVRDTGSQYYGQDLCSKLKAGEKVIPYGW